MPPSDAPPPGAEARPRSSKLGGSDDGSPATPPSLNTPPLAPPDLHPTPHHGSYLCSEMNVLLDMQVADRAVMFAPPQSDPTDWEIRFSKSRQLPYFYSPSTSTSIWEAPASLSPAQVASLPGAHHLRPVEKEDAPGGGGAGVGPERVRASHLLVKHKGSRRPSSWKEVRWRTSLLPRREMCRPGRDTRLLTWPHTVTTFRPVAISPPSRAPRRRPSRSSRATSRQSSKTCRSSPNSVRPAHTAR
jgi:hypothetical protein